MSAKKLKKFELRYGGKTATVEVNMSLEEFLEELSTAAWWVLDDEPIGIQVKTIDSVKELKE